MNKILLKNLFVFSDGSFFFEFNVYNNKNVKYLNKDIKKLQETAKKQSFDNVSNLNIYRKKVFK